MLFCYALAAWDEWGDSVARLRLNPFLERPSHADASAVYTPMPYEPGQYIDVLFPNGTFRPYSIAGGADHDGGFVLHLRHRAEDQLCHALKAQALASREMMFSGPFGYCHLSRYPLGAWHLLLVQGTGFAPAHALIEASLAAGDGRRWHLFWQSATPSGLYDDAHMTELAKAHPDHLRYTPMVSALGSEAVMSHQVLCDAVLGMYQDLSSTFIYLSGTPVMAFAAREQLMAHGADASRILSDYFDAPPVGGV
jgi:CDP-4-dehydro-6-deoxyglucose reductase, E3